MAIDVELKTLKQSNTTWPSTFKASNRFPIVANRVFATLANAQAYVDDTAADASAYAGIVLAVVQDTIAKNNGVYYVQSHAVETDDLENYPNGIIPGKLVKVGGAETETATTYSVAVTLSQTLVTGQLIKVASGETVGDNTYKAGFYIVETPGTISALDTSTGAVDEVGALKTRVDALEANKADLTGLTALQTTVNSKVDNTTFVGHSENGEIHVSATDKAKWNNAASAATTNTNDIAQLTLNKADASALTGYVKIEDAYDDAEVRGLITAETTARTEAFNTLSGAIDTKVSISVFNTLTGTVESNYNTLNGLITAETTARIDAITALTETVNTKASNDDLTAHTTNGGIHVTTDDKNKWDDVVTRFNTFISGDTEAALDTLVDLQTWINEHGTEAQAMATAITANYDSITALTETVSDNYSTLEGLISAETTARIDAITALTETVNTKAAQSDLESLVTSATTLESNLKTLEGIVGNETDDSGIFSKISALASNKLNSNVTVNGVSFENDELTVHAGHVALENAITRTDENGDVEQVYASTSSIQAVLANLSQRIDVLDPNVSGELGITSIIEGAGISGSTSGGQATISIKKSTKANNAVVLETDGLYVQAITIEGDDIEVSNN